MVYGTGRGLLCTAKGGVCRLLAVGALVHDDLLIRGQGNQPVVASDGWCESAAIRRYASRALGGWSAGCCAFVPGVRKWVGGGARRIVDKASRRRHPWWRRS